MMSFSKLSIASLGAIALIGATSAPAMASPGTKAAVACQGGLQGCVLPVGNAAPAPAPAPAAAPVAAPVAVPAEAASTGWILPALLAVAAAVGLYFLLDDDNDDDAISA